MYKAITSSNNVIYSVISLFSLCLAETLHSSFHSAVSLKHHFFDSGLLYQFCINFRRRRRLSELLHEIENEEAGCITQHNQEDQADSPFTLRKTSPSESNSDFLSGINILSKILQIYFHALIWRVRAWAVVLRQIAQFIQSDFRHTNCRVSPVWSNIAIWS